MLRDLVWEALWEVFQDQWCKDSLRIFGRDGAQDYFLTCFGQEEQIFFLKKQGFGFVAFLWSDATGRTYDPSQQNCS